MPARPILTLLRYRATHVNVWSNKMSLTEAEREKNVFGDPLETIWRNCIFGLCGVKNFYRRVFSIIVTSTRIQREQWLDEVKSNINALFPRDAQT